MKHLATLITLLAAATINLSAADAKENWDSQCAKCHGADGKGKTKMGAKLNVKDYTDAKVQADMKDDAMAKSIKEGVKDKSGDKEVMKAYSDLSDAEVKALVSKIREFKK